MTGHSIEFCPTFVARIEADSVGFYQLVSNQPLIRLEHLWVHPEQLRKGIGRSLLQHASALARTTPAFDTDPHRMSKRFIQPAARIVLAALLLPFQDIPIDVRPPQMACRLLPDE